MKKLILSIIFTLILSVGCFAGDIKSGGGLQEKLLLSYFSDINTIVNEIKADYNLMRSQMLTSNLDDKNVAEGTVTASIKTTTTGNYSISGLIYNISATDNVVMSATATQNYSSEVTCNYLVSLDSGGNFTVTKGSGTTLPALPASNCPISYFQIVLSAAGSFVGGTTDLSATSVNATFYDITTITNGTSASTAISNSDLSLLNH